MKLAIASILLVATVCATNEVHAALTPKSFAIHTYAGTKCGSNPRSVVIVAPPEGMVCKPKTCTIGGDSLPFKEECVSGDGDDYVKTILKEFKKGPVVLTVQYGADTACSGKPQVALGEVASGLCTSGHGPAGTGGKKLTINKDRSVRTEYFADVMCTGSPIDVQTQPATETKGQCTNGVKVIALRNAKDKF